jgi:hypothetical protein
VTLSLADGAETFPTTCLPAADPAGIVLFCCRRRRRSARHAPLLEHLSGKA